jgi:hypothetical protein
MQEGKNLVSELYDEVLQGGDLPDMPVDRSHWNGD